MKNRSEIAIWEIAENPTKKKTDEQLNERTFVSCDKPTNTFVKMNGSVNVH